MFGKCLQINNFLSHIRRITSIISLLNVPFCPELLLLVIARDVILKDKPILMLNLMTAVRLAIAKHRKSKTNPQLING